MKSENKIFSINNISKTYGAGEGKTVALKDISFDIYKGEFLAILGSSGSGKSTLLNMIGGMDKPDSGEIIFNGKDICKYKEREMTDYRKESIGFIFQSFNLISELTVYENVALTTRNKRNKKVVNDVLKVVELFNKKHKYPNQLSGGEQQRVSIARALAKNTDILLCDEPTGALDYETGKQILIEIEKLSKEYGKTIIMVTHTREICKMADRVITMKSGSIIDEKENNEKISAKDVEW